MWNRIDSSLAELFSALDGGPLSDEMVAREETRELVSMTVANLPDRYAGSPMDLDEGTSYYFTSYGYDDATPAPGNWTTGAAPHRAGWP